MPPDPTVAEAYHRLTEYSPEVLQTAPGIDWSRQPVPYKRIVGSERIALRGAPSPELAALGRTLFHANGVTGQVRFPGGASHFLRAAPSAGALYPTEVYVALRDAPGAETGIYNYQVRDHELVRLWEGDHFAELAAACRGAGGLADATACVVLTGVFWRSAWRYQERGYRRVLLDTGHVLANLCAYGPHEGWHAAPVLAFEDAHVNGMLFFQDHVEAVLAVVPLHGAPRAGAPLLSSGAPARCPPFAFAPIGEEADLAASASAALHRTSAGIVDGETAGTAGAAEAHADAELDEAVPHAISRRRSARGYAGGGIDAAVLERCVAYAFGAPCGTRAAGLLRARVVAHRVDGREPGLYDVAADGTLQRVGAGDWRRRLHHLSLGQDIARDCAAVLVLAAPAQASLAAYGNRAYRYLHLEAGAIGERLQLAATAQGLAACGIAGFFDQDAAEVAGVAATDWPLYLITLGTVPPGTVPGTVPGTSSASS